jgi:hypothetical protein
MRDYSAAMNQNNPANKETIMIMKNTSEMDFEYPLNPKTLRENAEFICEQVQSNTSVLLFKCDGCGQLHIRYIPDEDDAFQTNSIH